MNKYNDAIAQRIYERYIRCLTEYFNCDNVLHDLPFMTEIEEKIIKIVGIRYASDGKGNFNSEAAHPHRDVLADKARSFLKNILSPVGQLKDSTYLRWNDVMVMQQCIENYLDKHPEITREHRLITDNWESSSEVES